MGRPSGYDPAYCDEVAGLLANGATDEEIAAALDVSTRTLYRWQAAHPDFCHALKAGKEPADDRAVRSLYQKATGFHYVEQQAIKVKRGPHEEVVEIVEVERYQPADTTAAIFWLKNRRPNDWRDVSRREFTGEDGGPVQYERIERTIHDPTERAEHTNGTGIPTAH